MLIPIVLIVVALLVALLILGVIKKSRRILAVLSAICWSCSLVSAFFVGWAWTERAYSENWAIYGFFFVSLPIIITTGFIAIAAIAALVLRKIENMRIVILSFGVLLLFLAAQVVFGFMAG